MQFDKIKQSSETVMTSTHIITFKYKFEIKLNEKRCHILLNI